MFRHPPDVSFGFHNMGLDIKTGEIWSAVPKVQKMAWVQKVVFTAEPSWQK